MAYTHFGARKKLGVSLLVAGVLASIYLAASPPNVANGHQMILADHGIFARPLTWEFAAFMLVAGMVFWSPSIRSPLTKFAVELGNAS